MKIKPKYYWDANVFLSHIKGKNKGENRTKEETTNLQAVVQEVDENKVILVTSAFTSIEVLAGKLTNEQKQRYDSIFQRPNIVVINVHPGIVEKAAEIREYYLALGKSIKSPDSIHLATALLVGVDVLHTFDSDDLIPLDGNVMGHNLRISKPFCQQGILNL